MTTTSGNEDNQPEGDDRFPYSFDEYNAIRLNTGRNKIDFTEYVTSYLREHSDRMDLRSWDALVMFGAVDAPENGENHV
jgi:hypothetical protein